MKLTIIQTGEVPPSLRSRFGVYPPMFGRMFEKAGETFDYETIAMGGGGGMLMVSATGTAIVYEE